MLVFELLNPLKQGNTLGLKSTRGREREGQNDHDGQKQDMEYRAGQAATLTDLSFFIAWRCPALTFDTSYIHNKYIQLYIYIYILRIKFEGEANYVGIVMFIKIFSLLIYTFRLCRCKWYVHMWPVTEQRVSLHITTLCCLSYHPMPLRRHRQPPRLPT